MNRDRTNTNGVMYQKWVLIMASALALIGSVLITCFSKDLSSKWELSSDMLLTFGIFTALFSILGLIGSLRYNYCAVLSFAIFMSINSLVLIVLTFNRTQLIPILVMVLLTTGLSFLFSNTLRNVNAVTRDQFIAVNRDIV